VATPDDARQALVPQAGGMDGPFTMIYSTMTVQQAADA
jgi:hypothetical protein